MVRGFAVLLGALVATSASAQEAQAGHKSRPEPGKAVLLASTTPMTTHQGPAAPEPPRADCSIVESFLDGTVVAMRTYQEPTAATETRQSPGAWKQAPFVRAVARCGQRYIIQVKSRSKDEWVIDRARLEGPKGEVLKVSSLRHRSRANGYSLNVIVAEAPLGSAPQHLRLDLSGQDGRVAVVEDVVLP